MKNSDNNATEKFKETLNRGNVTRVWKLDSALRCRNFLKEIRFNGKKATFIILESGKELAFKEMTDEQAIHYANEIAGWIK